MWGAHHRGLQLFGEAALSHNRAAHRLYASRFPKYEEFIEKAPAARELRFYRFTPATIKILDEEQFGEIVYITAEVVPSPRS